MASPSYTDAIGYLTRYLVRTATGMAANSVRPARQSYPSGKQDEEYATVLIIDDEGDLSSAARRTENYTYPVWSSTTTYTVGTKVTHGALAFVCSVAVTGGAGPTTDTTHWTATAQATQVTETLDVWHDFTASVQFFRHSPSAVCWAGFSPIGHIAFDRASRLQTLLMLSTNMELMQRLGLLLRGASKALDVSALVDSTWEDRGSVDLYFGCSTPESVLLESFATAQIDLKAQWPSGLTDSKTIEVPS